MTKNNRVNIKTLPHIWPMNVNFAQIFGNENPIDVEIGMGRPHFFFERALNFHERNIVGIEWKFEFVKSAQRRILREGITNALALHGNAWMLVPLLFQPLSIDTVMVNFPDPWWKSRHKERLVLNETFLTLLHNKMINNGKIILQTDVLEIFNFYNNLIIQHQFINLNQSFIQIEEAIIAKTHREKKCLEQGLTVYRTIFTKG